METMGKKDHTPTNLELFFLDKKELEEMTSEESFHSFVKEEAFKAISYAIKNKKRKAQIFRLWNLGFLVTIKEREYKSALQYFTQRKKLSVEEFQKLYEVTNYTDGKRFSL